MIVAHHKKHKNHKSKKSKFFNNLVKTALAHFLTSVNVSNTAAITNY